MEILGLGTSGWRKESNPPGVQSRTACVRGEQASTSPAGTASASAVTRMRLGP